MSNVKVYGKANGCARCQQSFRSLESFDRHQDVNYDRADAVQCRAPASIGLVQDDRGVWQTPAGLAALERACQLLERIHAPAQDAPAKAPVRSRRRRKHPQAPRTSPRAQSC